MESREETRLKKGSIRFLWRDITAGEGFKSGVSLHSHTMHSRENLSFVPHYALRIPLLCREFSRQHNKYRAATGRDFDFSQSYWTPPLSSHRAWDLERSQIERCLNLQALVSLTDHDSIEAGCQLQILEQEIPISIEWTVPFAATYFHLGVHNLQVEEAREIAAEMARYTRTPNDPLLLELLEALNSCDGTISVMNHPFWDQSGIGTALHASTLELFLKIAGPRVHALELNGLRPWAENRASIALARDLNYPLVSGGDRHGCEPNAIVNLTNAASFAEFASEVRSGASHLLFLPQYREPLQLRMLQTLCDVVRHSPELPGRELWMDRVFFCTRPDSCVPLSSRWSGCEPAVVKYFIAAACLLGHRRVQGALRQWFTVEHEFAL